MGPRGTDLGSKGAMQGHGLGVDGRGVRVALSCGARRVQKPSRRAQPLLGGEALGGAARPEATGSGLKRSVNDSRASIRLDSEDSGTRGRRGESGVGNERLQQSVSESSAVKASQLWLQWS